MLIFNLCSLLILCYTINVNGGCDKNPRKQLQLRNSIFCNYDPVERPVADSRHSTNISMQLLLKNMYYITDPPGLMINFWLKMTWVDNLLNWKPEEYDDINTLVVKPENIWHPDFQIQDRLEHSGSSSMTEVEHCTLNYTGTISCVSPNNHKIQCETNLKYFPFDKKTCYMMVGRLGSWLQENENINLHNTEPAIDKSDYTDVGEWRLNTTNVLHFAAYLPGPENITFEFMSYTFTIERHLDAHITIAIIPAITMFVLTCVTFFMDIQSPERTIVISSNIILHIMYLQFYKWILPNYGPDPPLILTFTRDSLIMATFMLILTIWLRKWIVCNGESPNWINTATTFAINSKIVQTVFVFEGSLKEAANHLGVEGVSSTTEDESAVPPRNDWIILTKLLDRLALILYFIIYLSLAIAFIPVPENDTEI